jgi:hypothetical protein
MTTALLPRGRRRALVPMLLVALFLASCGRNVASTIEASTPHDVIVVGKPAARVQDPEGEHEGPVGRPTLVVSRDDLVGESRVLPDEVWVDSADPTQLRVRFTAGAVPCAGARLSVDAGPATVGVALYVGTPREHTDTICDASAHVLEVRATLDRPLGTREVIWRVD